MKRTLHILPLVVVVLALAGCGTMRSSVVFEPAPGTAGASTLRPARTPIPGGSYRVIKGDTLYSIAFRKGVDFRDLAQWNRIAAPYTIWPGQQLRLSPPGAMHPSSHAMSTAASSGAPIHRALPPPASAPAAPVFQPVTPAAAAGEPISAAPAQARAAAAAPSHVVAAVPVVPVAGSPAPVALPPPSPPSVPVAGQSRAKSGVEWRWPAGGSIIKGFKSSDAIPGIEIAGKQGDPVRAAADGVVVYSGNGLVGYGELVIIKHNDSFLSAYGHNSKRLVKEGQRVTAGQPVAEMGSTGASRTELEFQIRKDGNPVDPMDYLPHR